MKTAAIIILVILAIIALLYWLRRQIIKILQELKTGRENMQSSAAEIKKESREIQLSHKSCQLSLAHIQPGKMYETLESLIPKFEKAVDGIDSMQEKLDNHSTEITNLKKQNCSHENRITNIEKLIQRWDEAKN